MSPSRLRTGLAAIAFFASAAAASAGQLHPMVAQPLNQLLVAAAQGCQMGNAQACQIGQQLNVFGNQLFYVQSACEQGDQNACLQLNTAAAQLNSEVQAMMQPQQMPQFSPADQMALQNRSMADHQQRMATQRQNFEAHQARMREQSAMMDSNHQQFMNSLRQ